MDITMRPLFILTSVVLAACSTSTATISPTPKSEEAVSQPNSTKTRTMTFSAKRNDVAVVARCTVRGPEFDRSFATPAKLEIPIDSSGRALISFVSCDASGQRAEANDIPGPETKTVSARFGGSGLFGDKALLFGPSPRSVQYFVRSTDEGVIRVGRASDP